MSYAVFNTANQDAVLRASGPSIRVLGLYCDQDAVDTIKEQCQTETRQWQMSKPDMLHWRTVSNTNLMALGPNALGPALDAEYAQIPKKVEAWNLWRREQSQDVLDAAANKTRRSEAQVIATHFLNDCETIKKEAIEATEPAKPEEHAEPAIERVSITKIPKVKEVSTSHELRGQSWALIAILGDAHYEQEKQRLLNDLGTFYLSSFKHNDDDVQSLHYTEALKQAEALQQQEAFDLKVAETHTHIKALREEPLVAFFAASESAEDLVKQADDLSKRPELLHADLAVVRMYSWLTLKTIKNPKIHHKARDPKAEEFFERLRASSA